MSTKYPVINAPNAEMFSIYMRAKRKAIQSQNQGIDSLCRLQSLIPRSGKKGLPP